MNVKGESVIIFFFFFRNFVFVSNVLGKYFIASHGLYDIENVKTS